jgi:hypothetical protein|tara:strand:+ start:360 stop:857 length:498 start_codon:yes stop_codon:yes gene_type:complete
MNKIDRDRGPRSAELRSSVPKPVLQASTLGVSDGESTRRSVPADDRKIAYLAGLFDGEGSVTYKQYLENRKTRPNPSLCWRLRLELAMTCKDTVEHIYKTLNVGWFGPRTVRPGCLPQWRWSVSFRGAYEVAKLFIPHAITKKVKLQKIIDHYDQEKGNQRRKIR